MYAKMENGMIKYAPKTMRVGNTTICNPTEQILSDLGYKPVIDVGTVIPDGIIEYTEEPNRIVRTWSAVEVDGDDISPEEVVTALEELL